jgi:hypothetical protein
MTSEGKPIGRVIALVVFLVASTVALRGYVPGSQHTPSQQPIGSASAFVAVVGLLGASLAVIAIAVVARVRTRRVVAAGPAERSDWFRGGRGGGGRSRWRALLIGLGLIAAFVVIVVLLAVLLRLALVHTRLGVPPRIATPAGGTPAPAHHPPSESGPSPLGYLYATTMLFLVLLLSAGSIIALRRKRRAAQPPRDTRQDLQPSAPEVRSESLARAAELGLAEVGDLGREPGRAIIACYAAMERELGNVPDAVPQDFDTASEVLARAVEIRALHADSAVPLVDLFVEARFSGHEMNEGHRDMAVRALELVLAELRIVA